MTELCPSSKQLGFVKPNTNRCKTCSSRARKEQKNGAPIGDRLCFFENIPKNIGAEPKISVLLKPNQASRQTKCFKNNKVCKHNSKNQGLNSYYQSQKAWIAQFAVLQDSAKAYYS